MNKTTPKKIMEIIYIFILPLLFMSFLVTKSQLEIEQNTQILTQTYFDYNDEIITPLNPIRIVFDFVCDALNIESYGLVMTLIIDYINLWFIMFITWHLFYLFFDTLMHKVLLRKE